MKALLAVLAVLLYLTQSALASGGSVYHNGIGFTVIGIDDGTWTDINICDSEDNAMEGLSPHCLILKKGSKLKDGWTVYSDAKSGCRLKGKYTEQNFATGDTDDDFMLNEFIAIIKVPKGTRACTLMYNGISTPVRRSVTGLYR